MKRCPACGVERAHPSTCSATTPAADEKLQKCPQELEENPYAKTYGKRPTAPPTAHSAPGPAWEHSPYEAQAAGRVARRAADETARRSGLRALLIKEWWSQGRPPSGPSARAAAARLQEDGPRARQALRCES